MNRMMIFIAAVLFSASVISCNQLNRSNNTQQEQMMPGEGMPQREFDPEAMISRQMEDMKSQLDLTTDQEEKIREILKDGMEKMQKAREEMRDSGDGFEGMRESMQQMRDEQDKAIKELLSEDQLQKYETYREEMRSRMGRGFGPGRN